MLYPTSWLAAYGLYAAVILSFAALGAVAILRRGSPQERSLLGMLGDDQPGAGRDPRPVVR